MCTPLALSWYKGTFFLAKSMRASQKNVSMTSLVNGPTLTCFSADSVGETNCFVCYLVSGVGQRPWNGAKTPSDWGWTTPNSTSKLSDDWVCGQSSGKLSRFQVINYNETTEAMASEFSLISNIRCANSMPWFILIVSGVATPIEQFFTIEIVVA